MLNNLYTPKQLDTLRFAINNDYFMLINHGAKRTGKTILDNDLFLYELRRVRSIAKRQGVNEPQYILAGADLGAVNRNVLIELSNKYGIEFHFDRFNRFELFGVRVCCFGHSKLNDLGRIRGMTAFGAYINEGTMAKQEVFDEIKSRCSGDGARILVDTNPDNPEHWLKKDYIDKADGKTIKAVHYRLDDNTFLSERYKQNMKETTPSGMFYDRNIEGLWVMGVGVIYRDFNQKIHYISREKLKKVNFVKYIAGVDWGYEHFGAVVVLGADDKGNYYLIKEIAERFQEIDFWLNNALRIKSQYGDITFYCDSARPEYVKKFKNNGLRAKNADKSVLSGIERVAQLYKQRKLFIVDDVKRFREEIYMYVWNEKTGEPVKEYDDVQDAIRYAIYTSENKKGGLSILK